MFADLQYANPEGTMIRARRDDDSIRIIEPSSGDLWQSAVGGAFGSIAGYVAPPPPPVTADAVNAERDRRLVAPFTFQGHSYDRGAQSLQRITGAATLAGFAMAAGAQAGNYLWHGGQSPFSWITAANDLVQMDAPTAFAFGQEAAAVETRIIFAAFALKQMNPIPEDFADDGYWP